MIGKGGATISEFQSQSGARIQLSRNHEYFPGTPDRIIMLSGTIGEILSAFEFILTKIYNEVWKNFSFMLNYSFSFICLFIHYTLKDVTQLLSMRCL